MVTMGLVQLIIFISATSKPLPSHSPWTSCLASKRQWRGVTSVWLCPGWWSTAAWWMSMLCLSAIWPCSWRPWWLCIGVCVCVCVCLSVCLSFCLSLSVCLFSSPILTPLPSSSSSLQRLLSGCDSLYVSCDNLSWLAVWCWAPPLPSPPPPSSPVPLLASVPFPPVLVRGISSNDLLSFVPMR